MNKLQPKLISCMKKYSKEQFIKDIISGIIVAIIALPLSIALALASGVGPEQGLYTAIAAGFVISLLGGSRVQIAGPTAAFATIVAGIVAKNGFEGLVIREESAEYQFGGKRNNSMLKFKKKLDGLFTIVAINEDKRGLPILTLKNDINDETFDATLNATQIEQKRWLYLNPEAYGAIKALVEYRERSGVKEVPFHAKIIKITE